MQPSAHTVASTRPEGSPVFLVGMPASGKTYWGKKIAVHLGWHFTDLDFEVEAEAGRSIATIITSDGEERFRQIEHDCLLHLVQHSKTHTIVACGGGTPCYFNNMELMKSAGIVIYLDVSIHELLKHLEKEPGMRPLLHNAADPEAALQHLLRLRKRWYGLAHYILQSGDISLTTFEQIITQCTSKH